MKHLRRNAFTLVELLIVIGIIGLLAVTVLVTLNPAEAQKKTRDTKRLKDMQVLQAIIEQYISDGNAIPARWATVTTGVQSNMTAASTTAGSYTLTTDMPCDAASNWLGINACAYTRTVPVDPSNNRATQCATSTGTTSACTGIYRLRVNGAGSADYELGTRLESVSNAGKLAADGGDDPDWFKFTTTSIAFSK